MENINNKILPFNMLPVSIKQTYCQYLQIQFINITTREYYLSQLKQSEEELNLLILNKNTLLEKLTQSKLELNRLSNLDVIEKKISLIFSSISDCEKELQEFNKEMALAIIKNVNLGMNKIQLEGNLVNENKLFWEGIESSIKSLNDLNKGLSENNKIVEEYVINITDIIEKLKIEKENYETKDKEIEQTEKQILQENIDVIKKNICKENEELYNMLII